MLKINDIMTRDVFTLGIAEAADKAAYQLSVRGFTGAPVRDARGRLVGVLSRSDLTDPERGGGNLQGRLVRDLMTPGIFTLEASEPIERAARLMLREGIRRVIVTDREGQMVGIVTSTDVLELFAQRADAPQAPPPSHGFRGDQAGASM